MTGWGGKVKGRMVGCGVEWVDGGLICGVWRLSGGRQGVGLAIQGDVGLVGEVGLDN